MWENQSASTLEQVPTQKKLNSMKNNLLSAFSERSFLYLWLGEVFTQISVNLFNFFLIIVVFSLTKSNTAVSGVIISFTIPAILFGVLAGVYVDHWNKKNVLIGTNVIRAILLIFLVFFHDNIIAIYTVSFLISFITQFFIPAETPIIPLLVKKQHLLAANALFGMGIFGSILIAYVLAGPMLIFFGEVNTLIFLAFLLLLGAAFISIIKYEKQNNHPIKDHLTSKLEIQKEVRNALSLMIKTREIYSSLFLLALSQILILIVATVTPGYADKVLHMNVEEFPLIFVTPAAFGMVTGAVVLVSFFNHIRKTKIISVGIYLSGISMLILPFASILASKEMVQTFNTFLPPNLGITNIHILSVLAFFLGFSNALVFVPCNTILQEKTSDEFRGKIYGVLNALVGIFSLLPIILVGSLSDLLGVENVIIGIGLSLLGIGIVRQLFK